MAGNSFVLVNAVAEQLAPSLHAKGEFTGTLSKTYEKQFGPFSSSTIKAGDTIRIPIPARFKAEMGTVAHPEDTVEDSVFLTVYPFMVSAYVTNLQKALDVDGESGVKKHITDQMILPLLRLIETTALSLASGKVWSFSGNPGSAPSTFLQYAEATDRMTEYLIPDANNILGMIYPNSFSRTMDANKALPAQSGIENVYAKKRMKNVAGIDLMRSVSLPNYEAPALNGNSPQVFLSNQTGSTLNIDGMPHNYLIPEGTRFTCGPLAVDPESKQTLSFEQYFVTTGDVTTDNSGAVALPIDPPIVTEGNQQSVDVSPINNDPIVFTGANASGTTTFKYKTNLIYTPEMFAFACFPAAPFYTKGFSKVSEYEGIGMTLSMGPDIITGLEIIRADLIMGIGCIRPGWGSVMIGDKVGA